MPLAAEPPVSSTLEKSALAGESAFDQFATTATPPEGFSDGLRAAQAKDKGVPAPEPVKPAAVATPEPAKASATPPKVPSLPTTPAASQDDYEPKGETAKHWKAMKARHAAELETIRADLDRTKAEAAKAVAGPEVEHLRSELKRYQETLRDVAIERDPQFQQKFAPREAAIVDQIKLAAGTNGDKLAALLKYPPSPLRDEQIKALTDDLPDTAQRRINAGLGVLDQIDMERQAEIAGNRANFDAKQNSLFAQRNDQQAKVKQEIQAAYEEVSSEWSQKNPFFAERPGDEEHNNAVAESRQLAKSIWEGKLDPKELAMAAHWAAMGRRALDGWSNMRKERDEAIAALDKIRGVQPGDGKAGSVTETDGSDNAPKPGDPGYYKYMQENLNLARQKDLRR